MPRSMNETEFDVWYAGLFKPTPVEYTDSAAMSKVTNLVANLVAADNPRHECGYADGQSKNRRQKKKAVTCTSCGKHFDKQGKLDFHKLHEKTTCSGYKRVRSPWESRAYI